MKTMFQLLLVMMIFGGAATGGTLFWKKQQSELKAALQRAEAAEAKAAETPLAALEKRAQNQTAQEEPPNEEPEAPIAVRPPYVEGMDETSPLVVALNQRLRTTYEKELRLDERQEVLKLIFADIRAEQVAINQLREKANKVTQEERDWLKKEHAEINQLRDKAAKANPTERDRLRQELEELNQHREPADSATPDESELLRQKLDALEAPPPKTEVTAPTKEATPAVPSVSVTSDPAALKRLGTIFDSMPAEVVAEVLQQLAKQDRDAAIVEILKNMKDRQAAKVLATIAASDPAKAAALIELLKQP